MKALAAFLIYFILVPIFTFAVGAEKSGNLETPIQRDILVTQTYLLIPIKIGAPERRLRFVVNGKTVRDFEVELAEGKPDFMVWSEISSFKNKTISIMIADTLGRASLEGIIEAGEYPDSALIYHEPKRPQFHFSVNRGCSTDPNGLVYYKGEYHLFCQYNPYGTKDAGAGKGGNLHWGHAVSTDLVRWSQLPIAVYPHKWKDLPYSGSAVVDSLNTAGFKNGVESPIVLIVPSTGRGVCLYYSTDRGRSFTEYEGNPLELSNDQFGGDRRFGGDPKVFWHEPSKRWIMITCDIVSTPPNHKPGTDGWVATASTRFKFFSSPDLKKWEFQSDVFDCWECPDFFELPVHPLSPIDSAGTNGDPLSKRWVLLPNQVPSLKAEKLDSGCYKLGSFDGKKFNEETAWLKLNWGNSYSAAQTFNGIPASDGRRINIGSSENVGINDQPFRRQMTFPCELSLHTTADGVRLFAWPVSEIKTLYTSTLDYSKTPLASGGTILPGLSGDLYDLSAEFSFGPDTESVGFIIRGVPVTINLKTLELKCGPSSAPLGSLQKKIKLRLLIDLGFIEIFADDGLIYMPMTVMMKKDDHAISVFAKGSGAELLSLTVHPLKSAW